MRDMTFRTRIFLCFLAVIVVTMVLPGVYIRQTIKQDGISETVRAAEREAALIGMLLGSATGEDADNLPSMFERLGIRLGIRITYIDRQGNVLAESDPKKHDVNALDNHADRLEVVSASQNGLGVSIRHSNTLDADLVYVAIPFAATEDLSAGFLRVAVPLERVEKRIAEAESQWFGILALGTVLALMLALALSTRLERSLKEMIRVVEGIAASPELVDIENTPVTLETSASNRQIPVATLNRRRLHILPGREFRRLARAVNEMADRIEEDLHTIAEHKAQLETILDVMDEGVLVIGAQGRIRLINPALVRFFPQSATAVGKLPVEVLPVVEVQEALDELLASPPDSRLVSTLEVEPEKGTVFSVHLVRPKAALNDVLAVVVFHDVSEMARIMRVRRDFVANVSHELRTPLTTITGYAETLRDTPPEDAPTCVRFAEIILRHARLMGSMVEDLLQLSRIESGAIPLELVPVRACVVIADVVTSCQALFAARKLTLDVVVDAAIMIRADSRFLAQVFRNLLENACRYAPEDSNIALSCVVATGMNGETAEAVFTVRDKGSGIPVSALTRVFERFYRVEKHRGASTGLGLAICKHIVERHGGRIWAEEGPGGVFCFTVPLADPEVRDAEHQSNL